MTVLTRANQQLFQRTPDECWNSLPELAHHCRLQREQSTDRWIPPEEISPRSDMTLTLGTDGVDANVNDWSFSQLCRMAGVSKDTLNRLSPTTASQALQETLPRSGKPLQLLMTDDLVRSVHGAAYTRLWNSELLATVQEFATDFQPPQKAVTGGTGLYCGEQDMFCFLIDPTLILFSKNESTGTRMKATDQIPQARKRLQSIGQLGLLIETRFNQLKTMIESSPAGTAPENGRLNNSAAPAQETFHDLIGALRRTVDCLAAQLNQPRRSAFHDEKVLQEIARALALSGNGEKFELVAESAIRSYCDARQDVHRYSHVAGLSAALRDDVVAGFTRVMEQHRRELQLLRIEIEEVPHGAAFDPEVHQIAKRVEATRPVTVNTVRDCLAPIFRWKNGQGQLRFKPAKVIVYVQSSGAGHALGS